MPLGGIELQLDLEFDRRSAFVTFVRTCMAPHEMTGDAQGELCS